MQRSPAFPDSVFVIALISVACAAQTDQPRSPESQPLIGNRPIRNGLGNASSGFVINPSLDTDPPQLPADFKAGGVLIFSKTMGYREEPAIQASNAALAAIAHSHLLPYFTTENGAVMNPQQLAKFKLVIWDNASGDVLTGDQKAAFRDWVERGGSFVGIHGAGGDPIVNSGHTSLADWKWYVESLIGAQFKVHSTVMPGDIHVEDRKSPLTKGLPPVWHRSEEWYAFESNPRQNFGFHVLATVDEKSYSPRRATMGEDHPLIWWHCVGRGRSFYSALGHAGAMYSEPLMIQLLDNAMSWSLARSSKGCSAA